MIKTNPSAILAPSFLILAAFASTGCDRSGEPQPTTTTAAPDTLAHEHVAPDTAAPPADEHAGHVGMEPQSQDVGTTPVAGGPHAGHAAAGGRPAVRAGTERHAGHERRMQPGAPARAHEQVPARPTEHAQHAPADAVERTPAHAQHELADTVAESEEHAQHAPADTVEQAAEHAAEHAPSDTVAHAPMHDVTRDTPSGMAGALGIPMQREASGTAWLPDESPMYALHAMRGRWMYMLHGVVYLQYINEGGTRGDEQFGSTNWLMGMAKTEAFGGYTTLRAMLSAEAATVGKCGYPNLLATGETCDGRPLHDRQHPHDLFMEVAASYERELSPRLGLQLYGGLAGEPALGPVAFPHRISAISNPMAPIGHHWHDATHISFGLVTAGLFGRRWKLEASAFNGREPDEERYNIDLDRLDSFAGRVWWLPNERWAIQLSSGHLKEAEPATDGHGRENVTRTTASATYHLPFARNSLIASTLLWGRNRHEGESTDALLLETNLDLGGRHIFFARAEQADKSGDDLQVFEPPPPCIGICPANAVGPSISQRTFRVRQLTGGYLYQFRPIGDMILSAGTRLSLSLLPKGLEQTYGSRSPAGATLFLSLRARAHRLDVHADMGH
jgi:hypothetical protein